MEIVASLQTAREAMNYLERTDPDVVVLDIEMPDMDGITALPLILQKSPDVAVIIASTVTRRNAEISLTCIVAWGARLHPEAGCAGRGDQRELSSCPDDAHSRAWRARAELPQRKRKRHRPMPDQRPRTGQERRECCAFVNTREAISLRPMPATAPRVLVVGSSTGGPQALTEICTRLGPVIDQAPVLITQHMPPTFTTILAEHLARATGRPAREAEDGEPIRAGHIYIAPGHRHLRVARSTARPSRFSTTRRPCIFASRQWMFCFHRRRRCGGAWVLGLMLTGMGTDGTPWRCATSSHRAAAS